MMKYMGDAKEKCAMWRKEGAASPDGLRSEEEKAAFRGDRLLISVKN
jgi:hypothetical protein